MLNQHSEVQQSEWNGTDQSPESSCKGKIKTHVLEMQSPNLYINDILKARPLDSRITSGREAGVREVQAEGGLS